MGAGQRDTPLCPHPSLSRLARCSSSLSPLRTPGSFEPQNSPCHTTGPKFIAPFLAKTEPRARLFFSVPVLPFLLCAVCAPCVLCVITFFKSLLLLCPPRTQ